MKALIIGQGGREHALVLALKKSKLNLEIHVIPGSDGMAEDAICHSDVDVNSKEIICSFCKNEKINFVVIGPEDPLVNGLADHLRANGVLTVGPSQVAAQLEGSKVFAKDFMNQYGVATSNYVAVASVSDTLEASVLFTPPYVLKADGLCGGKGVIICKTKEDLKEAATMMFDKKIFGVAARRAVLEQFLPGYELSVLVLTNGDKYEILPIAQDHKQLRDNDQGLNTGGMGTVAPLKIDKTLEENIIRNIIEPSLKGISARQYTYRGVMFLGIMVTLKGPMCLEYNVRFGDPETQVILPLLDGDWGEVFSELSQGKISPLKWKNENACCVVLAAPGYPENPERGVEILGELKFKSESSYFLHAGTKKLNKSEDVKSEQWVTNGGRVLCAVGVNTTKSDARDSAYAQAAKVNWRGLQKRNDIGLRKN